MLKAEAFPELTISSTTVSPGIGLSEATLWSNKTSLYIFI